MRLEVGITRAFTHMSSLNCLEDEVNTMTPQAFTFANSPFWPIAIGFFGLGTGYFIWGGQALFGYPKSGPEVDRTMGMWGFWMPGFCQCLTGVYLIV